MARSPEFWHGSDKRHEPLRIRIQLVADSPTTPARLIIEPNTATVTAGTQVLWIVQSQLYAPSVALRWSIRFCKGHPFASKAVAWEIVTLAVRGVGPLAHDGEFGLLTAEEPGDYKYDVHVNSAVDEKPIADEDPRLIVTHR